MHGRSCEKPLPAEVCSRLGYGAGGNTYHGCFKTFQALAQCPCPGLGRLHHSPAGQVCLVPHQYTCSRETIGASHLTVAVWEDSWRDKRASSLIPRCVKPHLREAPRSEVMSTTGDPAPAPEGRSGAGGRPFAPAAFAQPLC